MPCFVIIYPFKENTFVPIHVAFEITETLLFQTQSTTFKINEKYKFVRWMLFDILNLLNMFFNLLITLNNLIKA